MAFCATCRAKSGECACSVRSRSRERREAEKKSLPSRIERDEANKKPLVSSDDEEVSEHDFDPAMLKMVKYVSQQTSKKVTKEFQKVVNAAVDSAVKTVVQPQIDQITAKQVQTDQKFDKMEETLKELRAIIDELKSTKSAAPTSSSPTIAGSWEPRHVFVRGFAPYGCSSSAKLTRTEYTAHAKVFMDLLPQHLKSSVKVDDPYPLSFQLSFRVSGGRHTCQIVREYFADGIDTGDIKIKDQAVKASIEVSAEKRGAFKALYGALVRVNSTMDESAVEVCKRSFTIYEMPEFNIIANIPKGSTQVQWNADTCSRLGISTERM